MGGRVVALQRSPARGEATDRVEALELRAGRGIVGDHRYREDGDFGPKGPSRQVTLLAREAIARVNAQRHWDIDPLALRRNVLTEGVDLAALVGERFFVGEVVLVGIRAARPCLHIERQTRAGLVDALGDAAGLRASIETGGRVRVGDAVAATKT